jgi:hypothetical protein
MNLSYKVPQDKHRITNHLNVMHLIIKGYAHNNIVISNIAEVPGVPPIDEKLD